MKPVAIIGAGITGLTAAFRLQQQNIPVTVYEASGRAGGVIKTRIENGYLSEYGPSAILETSPKITALITDLGLNGKRCNAKAESNKNYIVRNGQIMRVPNSPLAFFRTPLFSSSAKFRLFAEPFIPALRSEEDEALADFVVRRIGREFLDYAINPLVSGIYAGNPEHLSVRYAFPKLREVEQKYGSLILGQFLGAKERKKREEISKQDANKVSFAEGLQTLTDTLQQHLGSAVRLNSPVTALRQTAEGWAITIQNQGQSEEHAHPALLLCSPAHKLASIKTESNHGLTLSPLSEIEHPSIAAIVLGFRRQDVENPLDGYGFLVPKAERLTILGTTFSSSVFPNRAPADHVTLTSFIGGCRNPELAVLDPEKLFELTLRDMQKLLGVRGKPSYQHHEFIAKAIPQYNVGYGKYLTFMNETELKNPGLYFAGNYRNGISLADSILSGTTAAGRIAEFVRSTSTKAMEATK